MLNFVKGMFYVVFSVVLLASFIKVNEHFQGLEKQKNDRKKRLNEYYSQEYYIAYSMMRPGFLDGKFAETGQEDLEKAKKNAAYDGYDRADIEIMGSKAFKDSYNAMKLENNQN